MNSAIRFDKSHEEKTLATQIVSNFKDMINSDLLIRLGFHFS